MAEPGAADHDHRSGRPDAAPTRRPLGDVSPNITRSPPKHQRRSSGSPLKRSCTAALDSDNGFIYLKRRRISPGASPPSANASVAIFRDTAQEVTEDLPPLVSSQAPQRSPRAQSWHRSSSGQSFSSLINYDPSSQQYRASLTEPSSESTPLFLRSASRAEILRLRLRVAMYKVQTDQVDVPFDYLREHTASGTRESSRAVIEAVEQLRSEAQQRLAAQKSRSRDGAEEVDVASMVGFGHHTPRSRLGHMELTSSAVKSNVAEGLLGLKHAV